MFCVGGINASLMRGVSRHIMRIALSQGRHFVACALWAVSALACAEPSAVQLVLRCHVSSDVDLYIVLHNLGPTDSAVVLGSSIGNGQQYVADALVLDAKVSGSDTVATYEISIPHIFGRVDPWIVTLPAGSEFSLRRPLKAFASRGERLTIEPRGRDIRLRLPARTTGVAGPELVKVIAEELSTEWVHVPGQCQAG